MMAVAGRAVSRQLLLQTRRTGAERDIRMTRGSGVNIRAAGRRPANPGGPPTVEGLEPRALLSASHPLDVFHPPADSQAIYVRFRPSPFRVRPSVSGTPGDGSTLVPASVDRPRKPAGLRIDGLPR